MQRSFGVLVTIGICASCTRTEHKQDTPDAAVLDATAPADGGRPEPMADLLHATPATLGVSSTVQNPRDKPEHLVDGQLATAWNSKTGDLNGWIGFRIPEDARIDRIEMTVGFDRVTPTLDLFTANRRIRKIRVGLADSGRPCDTPGLREQGQEITLAVDRRGLQAIPMHAAPGGSYCIWVEETVAGSKSNWRELTVSELRVMGDPGAELRDPAIPLQVGVNEIPRRPTTFTPTPWREGADEALEDARVSAVPSNADSLAALMSSAVREWDRISAREDKEADPETRYVSRGKSRCKSAPITASFQANASVLEVSSLVCTDDWGQRTLFAVRTPSGWTLTPIELTRAPNDTDEIYEEWVHRGVERIDVQAGHIVVTEALQHETYYFETQPEPVVARAASWCRTQPSLQCSHWHPSSAPALGLKRKAGANSEQTLALAWQQEIPFEIRSDGKLHRR